MPWLGTITPDDGLWKRRNHAYPQLSGTCSARDRMYGKRVWKAVVKASPRFRQCARAALPIGPSVAMWIASNTVSSIVRATCAPGRHASSISR